jgi:hypothetical protein
MLKFSIILSIYFLSIDVIAQQTNLVNYFTKVREGKYPTLPAEVAKPENSANALDALLIYFNDSSAIVRAKAALLARYIGTQSKLGMVRAKSVQQLISTAKDKDIGNAGSSLVFLTEFKKSDFSKANLDSLYSLFKRRSNHLNKLIRLMGYLEIYPAKNELFTLSQDQRLGRNDRWAAMLALARLDDEQAANDLLNRVKRMPLTDGVVYEIFPDLIFTRRPEVIAFLIESLYSDAKNCEPTNSTSNDRVPCAYRIMEMLAPIIENYPLQQNASGDIETTDYPAALQKVREWFKAKNNYKILRDRY